MTPPLSDITVVDLSTLLPGPLATLLLAESGAEVIKVERPGSGEEMRSYQPRFGTDAANFALLNRGKRSLALDLKDARDRERLHELVAGADVFVEQFRPGVAERLGCGWEELRAINPRLVYCSISGYGQDGPRRDRVGHDLNYVAEAGLLSLVASDGRPVLPHALIADVAGGAYPAVMNILMALLARERDGRGRRLDVAMADNVLTFLYAALADGWAAGDWPGAGEQLTTGGTPRYDLYRAADGRWIAAAPIEDRFWAEFCDAIALPQRWRDDAADPEGTRGAVAERLASRSAAEWMRVFEGRDVCCSLVRGVDEVVTDPAVRTRGVFAHRVGDGDGNAIPALPLPLDRGLRSEPDERPYPRLGEHAAQASGPAGADAARNGTEPGR